MEMRAHKTSERGGEEGMLYAECFVGVVHDSVLMLEYSYGVQVICSAVKHQAYLRKSICSPLTHHEKDSTQKSCSSTLRTSCPSNHLHSSSNSATKSHKGSVRLTQDLSAPRTPCNPTQTPAPPFMPPPNLPTPTLRLVSIAILSPVKLFPVPASASRSVRK
jgi:hypothetical protein